MIKKVALPVLAGLALLVSASSCDKTKSYSDMLRDEEKACNWYLSNQRVVAEIPADSVFEIGPDAPFYKLDEDGYIYMQVINPGNGVKAQSGDIVYFRFARRNILLLQDGVNAPVEGNSEDLNSSVGNTSFVVGNYTLPSSSQWGSGIQKPLEFLGYESEVNLVLRAYYGFSSDQSTCVPYIINLRYFKPVY